MTIGDLNLTSPPTALVKMVGVTRATANEPVSLASATQT